MTDDEIHAELGDNKKETEAYGLWDDTRDIPELDLAYDTEDPEFSRGFQAGMIWQLLNGGVPEFEIPIYVTNTEMVLRMVEKTNYDFSVRYEDRSDPQAAEWMIVTFKSKDPEDYQE